ncbi:MAG: response regulator [Candidatus Margulisiibacteriota bacterium]
MKYKILIIDDENQFSGLLSFRLTKTIDCEVLTADNGEEGLKAAQMTHPHLIILDLLMPVMDGFVFLEKMADDITLKKIPVIVLTASTSPTSRDKLTKYLNVAEIFFKPVKPEVLIKRVNQLMASV